MGAHNVDISSYRIKVVSKEDTDDSLNNGITVISSDKDMISEFDNNLKQVKLINKDKISKIGIVSNQHIVEFDLDSGRWDLSIASSPEKPDWVTVLAIYLIQSYLDSADYTSENYNPNYLLEVIGHSVLGTEGGITEEVRKEILYG